MEDTEDWKGSLSQTELYLFNYQALIQAHMGCTVET